MAGCTVEAIKGIAFVGINIELFELCCAACICEEAVEGSTKAACRDPNIYSGNGHFDRIAFETSIQINGFSCGYHLSIV